MDARLGSALAVLVARTGAQAARLVDARDGGVLAQVGVIPAEDVSALVALARDAVPDSGGPEDLVLPTPGGVHILRAFPGVFVHLRVGAGPGVVTARRELAEPALRQAVDLRGARLAPPAGTVPVPQLPRPRHAQPGETQPGGSQPGGSQPGESQPGETPPGQTRSRHARPPRPRPPAPRDPSSPSAAPQPARTRHRVEPDHAGPSRHSRPLREPALAGLGPATGRAEAAGVLAVLAIAPAPDGPAPVTLPHRAVGAPPTRPQLAVARPLALPAVLRQEWAGDPATMGRLLDGLRRLN